MALPLRVEDLPSFADEELYEREEVSASKEEDPHFKRGWRAFLAGVRVVVREAEAGRGDGERLTADMDTLLGRLFDRELKSLEEYAGIGRDLPHLDLPPDQATQLQALWKDGAETFAALRDARKELLQTRAASQAFSRPPVIEYPEEGGVLVNQRGMEVGRPYIFDLGGASHVTVKQADESVEFHALVDPFKNGPTL